MKSLHQLVKTYRRNSYFSNPSKEIDTKLKIPPKRDWRCCILEQSFDRHSDTWLFWQIKSARAQKCNKSKTKTITEMKKKLHLVNILKPSSRVQGETCGFILKENQNKSDIASYFYSWSHCSVLSPGKKQNSEDCFSLHHEEKVGLN